MKVYVLFRQRENNPFDGDINDPRNVAAYFTKDAAESALRRYEAEHKGRSAAPGCRIVECEVQDGREEEG